MTMFPTRGVDIVGSCNVSKLFTARSVSVNVPLFFSSRLLINSGDTYGPSPTSPTPRFPTRAWRFLYHLGKHALFNSSSPATFRKATNLLQEFLRAVVINRLEIVSQNHTVVTNLNLILNAKDGKIHQREQVRSGDKVRVVT
ncbi:hypothetical protein BASA82_000286 [Batrachochytrium salamandrivorans]|nr:hypothetical protein BASA82_000286 [Batrachochytrium salamandrivorans]